MNAHDPYAMLGVDPTASAEEIKSAYRRLAMKYHPDRNSDPGAADMFKKITAAYENIGSSHKRGNQGQRNSSSGRNPFGAFEDFFGHVFHAHAAQQAQAAQRGHDVEVETTISLATAMMGGQVRVQGRVPVVCGDCSGTGAHNGVMEPCGTCHGRGSVASQMLGMRFNQICPACDGSGQTPKELCATCTGHGLTMAEKEWDLTVPAGIENGMRLRLIGEGGMGTGQAGDLYVVVHVAEHPLFRREGADLHITIPMRLTQAALGATVDVPTLTKSVSVSIPAGTQHGAVLVQKGMGGQTLRGKQGHLHVHVSVETPVKLTKEQKDLLAKFDETLTRKAAKHSPESNKFFDRLKKFF